MRQNELFYSLTEDVKDKKFDDAYLLKLIEFWQADDDKTEGNIFYASYALAHGNHEVALEYAEKALQKRKINLQLWRILRDAYWQKGDKKKAIFFAGLASKFYNEPVNLPIPREELQAILDVFSLAMGHGDFAPIAQGRMRFTPNGIEKKLAIFAGEYLPTLNEQNEYRLWSGAYTEQEMLDYKGKLLAKIKDDEEIAEICGADFTFDLMKGKTIKESETIQLAGSAVIVPIIGTVEHQQLNFLTDTGTTADWLGKWTSSFFRLEQTTTLSSAEPFVLGEPVLLEHSPRRKKVVLNILVDALCWRAVQEQDYELVPNILAFFEKGIIFSNHYSASEYTYPSFATIETGMYPQHSQLFNEKAADALNSEYITLSEQMKKQGYYCVNIMGCGEGVYDGTARGYDRLITNAYALPAYVGVERTIHQLEAFGECDQFLLLHMMDTHPWAAHTFQLPLTTQTHFGLSERSLKEEQKKNSVYLPNRPLYHHWNAQGIRDVDMALKKLFDHINANYAEDEYIIQLYSDHGVPIYDEKNYILSSHQTGAAFMLRGSGIPALGMVDELTSAVDIYPVLAHCAGFAVPEYVDGQLPAALGGTAREYTISMSMYPGIPWMICVRTKDYECRAESREVLDEDGRTDLADLSLHIYRRNSEQPVQSERLEAYFRDIIESFSQDINNHGRQWPEMRAKRWEWYEKDKA
ncbi:Arylsulfatase A [Selenomonas sp. GACV-9]|uniref:sulfatase-like hydrolase/transferase n=1 Tax=Selenomonas sp. GACV-9 TaxID=3158782 RepID=UPI0008EBF342|nr:Arylsulfatase A [Selenomonas ruminantium]